MKFVQLSPQYQNEWNQVVLNSDDAWFFHLYEWLPLTEYNWDLESKSFLVEYQGKFIGIFPLQLRRRSKTLKSTYMGLGGAALMNGLPEGVRKKVLKAMYEHVQEIAFLNQSPSIEVALSPLSPSSLNNVRNINPLIHYFYEDTSTHTWMVNLSQSEEEILNHYADDARRSIKKAKEEGYTVLPVTNLSGVEKYYEVRCETAMRNEIDPHPKDFFFGLYKNFCERGNAVIWEAKDAKGESVAFEVTALFKESALYWMGCCRTAHLDSGVNYLLQYHAMMWAKKQGARWFESGEAFPNVQQGKLRGLTLFKGKFGGELHRFFKGKIELADKNTQTSVFKDWVRASILLLKPVLKEQGVQKLEYCLYSVYKHVKKAGRVKNYFIRIQYLKPYWHGAELWTGISYSNQPSQQVVRELVAVFKNKLNMTGAIFPTSSGRTALELALKVIKQNNPQKNKVIVTTYGCRGVFDPVVNAGLQPVFSDINKELNLSYNFVEELLKCHDDVGAIVIPHLCGRAADIENLITLARQRGLVVIEDVCQSLGARRGDSHLGTQQDMSIFSFGMGKNLMATSGGMLVSRIFEEDLAKEYEHLGQEETDIVKARFWKIVLKYFLKLNVDLNKETISGYRYCKMHPLDARLITLQLKHMEQMIEKQRHNAQEIIGSLKGTDLKFHLQEDTNHIYSKLSIIFEDEKDSFRLEKALHNALIETEEMYTPLHLRDFSKNFFLGERLSHAERIYKNIFNIPVRPNLSQGQVKRIKRAIERVNTGRN